MSGISSDAGGSMVRVCLVCGRGYPDGIAFCTDDGSPLVGTPDALAKTALPVVAPTVQGGPATAPAATAELAQPQFVGLVPGTPVGEYTIEQQIGEGGMGVIYSARQPLIAKRVAIKVLNPDMATNAMIVQRFIQEARSVNQIGHRNIVDIFSFGALSDGRHYFVMEFLDGVPFSHRIRDPLEWSEAVAIWLQMASAVEAAHAVGIVHRDLKPDNIFVLKGGDGPFVKVLDFGIAKLMGENVGVSKTSTGVPMGTPLYMSPEQAVGGAIDHRTDVYAVGCILYESITGETPFGAPTFLEVMFKQMSELPPPFGARATVDTELEALVFQCLEKEADHRPASMREICERLTAMRDRAMRAGGALFTRAGEAATRAGMPHTTFPDELTAPRPPAPPPRKAPPRADRSDTVPEPRAPAARTGQYALLATIVGLIVASGAAFVFSGSSEKPTSPPPIVRAPAAPREGRLKLMATESGLEVFVDGVKVADGGPVIDIPLSPGKHQVKVTRQDFLPFSTEIMIASGDTTVAVLRLDKPAPANLPPAVAKPTARSTARPSVTAPKPPSDVKKGEGNNEALLPF